MGMKIKAGEEKKEELVCRICSNRCSSAQLLVQQGTRAVGERQKLPLLSSKNKQTLFWNQI